MRPRCGTAARTRSAPKRNAWWGQSGELASSTAPAGRSKVSPCHCSVSSCPASPANTGSARAASVRNTGSRPTSAVGARVDASAEARREELHAQTHSPERRAAPHGLRDQPLLVDEPRLLGLVVHAHRPAHRDDRVEAAKLGERLALVHLDPQQARHRGPAGRPRRPLVAHRRCAARREPAYPTTSPEKPVPGL